LALARRDSGEVDEALSFFLHEIALDAVLNPKEVFSDRGGSFYRNIDRSLFLSAITKEVSYI
jgi:hypothetical protein